VDVLRIRECRYCKQVFFICRSCDRGHAYCSEHCREEGYKRTRRAARAKHQSTKEGRDDHRERQKEHRRRLKNRVTDQTSQAAEASGKVKKEELAVESSAKVRVKRTRRRIAAHVRRFRLSRPQRCVVCGKESQYAVWHPAWERK